MDIPPWLDVNFFHTALNNYFKDNDVKILGFSCKPAVSVGENYTTDVFRASVTYAKDENIKEKKNMSVIVKSTRDGMLETFANEMNLFLKEIDMFVNILPKMSKICGKESVFAADCINAVLKPKAIIVMQDICPLGFAVRERRGGLDLHHVLQVVKTMASFHATSVVMCKKDTPILDDMYTEGLYTNKEVIVNWIKLGFESLQEAIGRCKEFKTYYEKLSKIPMDRIIELSMASCKRNNNEFVVLNHGDMWVNNIMFSYDAQGKVNDCKLIDFQLSVYGSPAIDLHYFFATSLADNIRNNINYLLDFYYANLLVALTVLDYSLINAPTREEFLEDYRRRAFYGFLSTATVLPLVKAEGRTDANFEDLMKDDTKDGFRYHCYNNEVYKSALSYLLPYYDKLGVLE